MKSNRNHGLDTLRAVAIILVFMFHFDFLNQRDTFGILGKIGYGGVDLFFSLSGYLIGNQILSTLSNQKYFSLKNFYSRRLLRTLPSYLFVLALYFLFPIIRENPLQTSLFKFLTFTQNFNLHGGAFSHAWSLCIEEQFYFILPIAILLLVPKISIKMAWYLLGSIILLGVILRSGLWLFYIQNVAGYQIYLTKIYFFTLTRLDGLLLGFSLAMLKNFHKDLWMKITDKGNIILIMGLFGCWLTCYQFNDLTKFFPTAFGYLLRSASFTALVLAALSQTTWLSQIRVPGALTLATWSYAIYLTHKQIIHLTFMIFSKTSFIKYNALIPVTAILVSLLGGWLLYTLVEVPFLKLRDRAVKETYREPIMQNSSNAA